MIKLLLIEDKDDHLGIIEEVLDQEKFSVHYSHDKKDGIEIASRYVPDLILFYFTGEVDLSFVKEIVTNSSTSALPLIIIPGSPSFKRQRTLMELGAEDYIPVDYLKTSLERTILSRFDKIKRLKEKLNEQIDSFEFAGKEVKQKDHLLVKIGRKLKLVKFSDIVCITALKEYSKIKTCDNLDILIRKSMRNWVKLLPSDSFLRIHRATIINLNFIDTIKENSSHTYTVSLKGIQNTFDFSYRYANIMRRTFPT